LYLGYLAGLSVMSDSFTEGTFLGGSLS
jgi:hypothetical protein